MRGAPDQPFPTNDQRTNPWFPSTSPPRRTRGLRADIYKVKADLVQIQLTSIGIILVAVGLMIHFKI
jgi:hypothetical protein